MCLNLQKSEPQTPKPKPHEAKAELHAKLQLVSALSARKIYICRKKADTDTEFF